MEEVRRQQRERIEGRAEKGKVAHQILVRAPKLQLRMAHDTHLRVHPSVLDVREEGQLGGTLGELGRQETVWDIQSQGKAECNGEAKRKWW
jgi:hypothetical protein